ncbi:MAG: guanylate kinase [Bacteroidota bacterium]
MEYFTQKLLIVSAPSGAGKTTLVREVMHAFDMFEFSISATTRSPRGKEQEGVDYYFLDESNFKGKVEKGEFVEWEEVYPGRFYGTLKSEIQRILGEGKCPIFDVDVEGGLSIKKQYGIQAVAVFICPPSEQILEDRLRRRATDAPEEIARRLGKVKLELSYAEKFDHQVVNDILDRAVAELESLIKQEFAFKI